MPTMSGRMNVWENECMGGYNSNRKRRGQEEVKEPHDDAIACLDSYKRKLKEKKERNK